MIRMIAFALALGVTIAPTQKSSPVSPPPWMDELLDSYANGNYPAFDDSLRGAIHTGTASALPQFLLVLKKSAPAWIKRAPAGEQERRRLVVAAVSLEGANRGGLDNWPAARAVIEWACQLVRQNRRALPAERTWHWGAISIFEGAADASPAQVHVSHALSRFPNDPRFLLARGIATELRTWPDPRDGKTPRERDASTVGLTVLRLDEARRFDEVRAEASLHLGYLALRNRDASESLPYFRESAKPGVDPFIRYLAQLFQGRALEALHKPADAIAAYHGAIAAEPGQTAQLALAAALARTGQQDAAADAAAASMRGVTVIDPWIIYGRGDARFWPEISARLRQEIR
uniref:Tetratricopeptide repeat protein n=1 Tax=uncultured bacterium 259 TaxID=698386 RepID=E3T6R5_9BACT|nr:hypothetical protein [uncultured bacterium 259]